MGRNLWMRRSFGGEAFRPVTVAAVPALCLMLAGCAAGTLGSSVSELDLTFVQAASTWDLDRDGTVTCDEWKKYAGQLAREADANGDGALNPEEFRRMSATDRLFELAGFKYFDANGDGSITFAELTEKQNPAFTHLDKNRDCRLTPDERPTPLTGPTGGAAKAAPDMGRGGGGRGGR